MKKPRPEFTAWKDLITSQISAEKSAIAHLQIELSARRKLLKTLERGLAKAKKLEPAD